MPKGTKTHKAFADQMDGEELLLLFRKHPIVMRRGLVLSSIGILLPVLYTGALTYLRPNNPPSLTFFFASIAAGFILGGLLMFPYWLSWYYSLYIVTNRRLIQIVQKGLFKRRVVDIGLNQIQMINYEINGLQETLLGYGTISMQTYVGELIIREVHHPAKLQRRLLGILRDQGVAAAGLNPQVA